jgi:hypothetical protein
VIRGPNDSGKDSPHSHQSERANLITRVMQYALVQIAENAAEHAADE